MKKTMFFVSAIVALAMGTMWVSCNGPVEGCTCTYYQNGQKSGSQYYPAEAMIMNDVHYTNCKAFGDAYTNEFARQGTPEWSVQCR